VFKKIDHVEIVSSDIEKTLKFYTEILGFNIQWRRKMDNPPMEEIVFIELGGTLIEVFSVREPAPISKKPWQVGCRTVALEVEDLDKAVEYLDTKGIKLSQEIVAVESLKRTEIKDPDGIPIELIQRW
jgi:glyoxylase I family protein